MPLNQSWKLGKVLGIKISLHWTFLILIGWIIISNWKQGHSYIDIIWSVLFVIIIFICVILHELGHSLAAQRYGIQTKSITILPIGGVASLEKIPEDPKQELVVAFAGPLVNVIIAIFLFAFLIITGGMEGEVEITKINENNFMAALLTVNLILVGFNLIPAFPMDGGRVLRAILSFKMDREKATGIAVLVGKFFSILFVFIGLLSNPFLVLIAVFIFLGAQAEYQHVKSTGLLTGYTVKDILMSDFSSLSSSAPLKDAVKELLDGQNERFLIVDHNTVKGILTKEDIIKGLSVYGEDVSIDKIMSTQFQSLSSSTTIQEVFELMTKNGYSILPVLANERLIGVVDLDNIYEFILIKGALKERNTHNA